MVTSVCPVCGSSLVCFCPKCRGSVSSEKKTAAARENAAAPRPNARGPRGRRLVEVFPDGIEAVVHGDEVAILTEPKEDSDAK